MLKNGVCFHANMQVMMRKGDGARENTTLRSKYFGIEGVLKLSEVFTVFQLELYFLLFLHRKIPSFFSPPKYPKPGEKEIPFLVVNTNNSCCQSHSLSIPLFPVENLHTISFFRTKNVVILVWLSSVDYYMKQLVSKTDNL